MLEYVHCETQEEWDFAVIKLNRTCGVPYKECGDSINIHNSGCSNFKSKINDAKFYSFQEWCDKFGHINPFIIKTKFKKGDEVKCVRIPTNYDWEEFNVSPIKVTFNKSDLLIVKDVGNDFKTISFIDHKEGWYPQSCFELITEPIKQLSKEEELLEYARKHYPIGTRYIPAHINKGINEVTANNHSFSEPYIHVESAYIEGTSSNCIYMSGKWAEIISKSEEVKEDNLIGRYVKALVDRPQSGAVDKDDIGIVTHFIKKEDWRVDFPNHKSYAANLNLSNKYELLPKDYSPKKEVKEDKPQFIVGKWYKNLGHLKDHIGKFKGFLHEGNPKTMSVSEYIYNKNLNGESINFTSAYNEAVECSLEEIQQYLPEGHVDKIVKLSIKTNPFKPGDLVVLVPENYDKSFYKEAKYYSDSLPKNTPLKVLSLNNNGIKKWNNWFIIVEGNNTFSLPFDCFKFAEPHEIPKESVTLQDIAGIRSDKPLTAGLVELKIISKFEIGDKVSTFKGNGIVSGFLDRRNLSLQIQILVKGIDNGHNGTAQNVTDKYGNKIELSGMDNYYFSESDLKLLSKHSLQDAVDKFNTQSKTDYTPLPFPKSGSYVKLIVIKDIPKELNGAWKHCPFIPKNTITWTNKTNWLKNEVLVIENNRWCSNIPKEYFEIIEEKYVVGIDPFEVKQESKKREPKVGDYVVFEVSKAIPLNLNTSLWDKDYLLKIDNIDAYNLCFSKETAIKAGMSPLHFNSCSNSKEVFRFATDAEIKAEVDKGHISLSDYMQTLFKEGIPYDTKLPYLSDFLQDEVQLLQPKEDKRFNTSVNKIESVKIQLKQKSKTIKF